MESLASSDLISMSVAFNKTARSALSRATGLNLSQYRVLTLAAAKPGGVGPRHASEAFGMKKSLFSQTAKSLCERKAAIPTTAGSITCTQTGHGTLKVADEAIALAHEEFFGCLGEKRRTNLLSGSVVTSVFFDVARLNEGEFLSEFATLDGCLRSELFYKEISHINLLSLAEMRVILALAERGNPLTQSDICLFLLLRKPEATTACQKLESKGLIARKIDGLDKRKALISLSAEGEKAIGQIVASILELSEVHIRPVANGEIGFYLEVASISVANQRNVQMKAK